MFKFLYFITFVSILLGNIEYVKAENEVDCSTSESKFDCVYSSYSGTYINPLRCYWERDEKAIEKYRKEDEETAGYCLPKGYSSCRIEKNENDCTEANCVWNEEDNICHPFKGCEDALTKTACMQGRLCQWISNKLGDDVVEYNKCRPKKNNNIKDNDPEICYSFDLRTKKICEFYSACEWVKLGTCKKKSCGQIKTKKECSISGFISNYCFWDSNNKKCSDFISCDKIKDVSACDTSIIYRNGQRCRLAEDKNKKLKCINFDCKSFRGGEDEYKLCKGYSIDYPKYCSFDIDTGSCGISKNECDIHMNSSECFKNEKCFWESGDVCKKPKSIPRYNWGSCIINPRKQCNDIEKISECKDRGDCFIENDDKGNPAFCRSIACSAADSDHGTESQHKACLLRAPYGCKAKFFIGGSYKECTLFPNK